MTASRRQGLTAFVSEAQSWTKAQWQEPRAARLCTVRLRVLVDFGFVTECYSLQHQGGRQRNKSSLVNTSCDCRR